MGVGGRNIDSVRAAACEGDWSTVRRTLADAVADAAAQPEALDLHAEACWWLGDVEACIAERERAYSLLLATDDRQAAARIAMLLSDNHLLRGRRGAASGWLRRAARLLADAPRCLQHGCLLLRQGEAAHGAGHLDEAFDRFAAALRIATEMQDADLEADALQATGRLLVQRGQPEEGLEHLDEAMLLAVEGRLSPFMTGKVYCSLVSACEDVGDLRRASEWSDTGSRWAAEHGAAVFPGLCRVHRAEVLQLRGDWHAAEAQAELACQELEGVQVRSAAIGFHELGEIRRRRGDLLAAEEAFQRAEALGFPPQPGLALLRLAQGRLAAATAGIDRSLSVAGDNALARAKLLPAKVRIALAAADVAAAAAAAEELAATAATWGSPAFAAEAAAARGRVELVAGRPEAACATLTEALRRWRDLEVPYEVAVARLLLGLACRAVDDVEGAQACFAAAVDQFEALGAVPDAEEARRLCSPAVAPARGGRAGAVLTARECEVLRLVATGRTNRGIAASLHLSEKTVARHLSNIFAKTGVASRAAATAYAFSNGIVDPG